MQGDEFQGPVLPCVHAYTPTPDIWKGQAGQSPLPTPSLPHPNLQPRTALLDKPHGLESEVQSGKLAQRARKWASFALTGFWCEAWLQRYKSSKISDFKGTVLRDRFQKCRQKLIDLGLNKGCGWFLNFSEAPLIFFWNKTPSFR